MSTIGNWRGPNIIKEGLVLYLDPGSPNSFYNKSGTVIKDISGNNFNGTLTNFGSQTIYNTSNGGSIIFDGTNDYIDNIGTTSTFSFIQNTGVYTISAWVKPSVLNKEMYICGNDSGTVAQKGFYLGTTSTNILIVITRGLSGTVATLVVNSCFLNTTDWVNVVVVGNGITNQFYRNGVVFGASSNTSTLSTGDSSFSLGIGFIKNATTKWLWNGNISNTLIYNKALSAQEILQNFNATKTRFGL